MSDGLASANQKVVLIVEDDPALSNIYERVLERGGFKVLAAANGREALELIHSGDPIHLMISDIVMPGIGGRELVWRVREDRPEMHIILVSGYASQDNALQTLEDAGVEFVSKPVALTTLLELVKEKLSVQD
jgi:DNA-binding NtrC family response regulator